MRRSRPLRPQALVVIMAVLVLLSRGEARFVSDAHDADQAEPQLAMIVDTPAPATPTPETVTQPTPTATPLPPTPTIPPTDPPIPSPTPTPEPTSTPVPVPTERPAAPPSGLANESLIIGQGESGRKEIAITFDAGDGRGHTLEILDILDEYGVVATFGVTGRWATENPDLLKEIVSRGNEVINHGFSHQSFTGASVGTEPLTDDQVRAEVLDTEQAIWENSGGYEVGPFFRFPYGDYTAAHLAILKQLGYDYTIWWGCDSKAWMGHTADDIVQECGHDKIAPGLIVLLHVDPEPDFEALPRLIETYQAAGYDLVTVEQLIQP